MKVTCPNCKAELEVFSKESTRARDRRLRQERCRHPEHPTMRTQPKCPACSFRSRRKPPNEHKRPGPKPRSVPAPCHSPDHPCYVAGGRTQHDARCPHAP